MVKGLSIVKNNDFVSERVCWDKLISAGALNNYVEAIGPELHDFSCHLINLTNTADNIDAAFDRLIGIIHDATQHLPRSRFRKHIKPFWNSQLKELEPLKVSAYKEWVACGRLGHADNCYFISYKVTKSPSQELFKPSGSVMKMTRSKRPSILLN